MNRRGQEHETNIVMIVILMAVIAIMVVLTMRFAGVWTSHETTIDCSAEIRAHAALLAHSNDLANPADIKCPTNVLRASGEEEAKATISKEMLRCWNQWGRGELRLFNDEAGSYCHVCGMVYVTDATQVNGLTTYLASTKVPGMSRTYANTLVSTTDGDYFDVAKMVPQDDVLPTSKPIGVIFRYRKDAQAAQKIKNFFADPTVAVPGGTIAGGLVAAGAGITSVAGITVLVAGGGVLAAMAGYSGIEPLDTIASVYAVPMDPGDIRSLDCDYAPVES